MAERRHNLPELPEPPGLRVSALIDGELSSDEADALTREIHAGDDPALEVAYAQSLRLKALVKDIPGRRGAPGELERVLGAVRAEAARLAVAGIDAADDDPGLLGPQVDRLCDGELAPDEAAPGLEAWLSTDAGATALEATRTLKSWVKALPSPARAGAGDLDRVLAAVRATATTAATNVDARAGATPTGLRIVENRGDRGDRSSALRTRRARVPAGSGAGWLTRVAAAVAAVVGIGWVLAGTGGPTVSLAYAPGVFAAFTHQPAPFEAVAPASTAPLPADLAQVPGVPGARLSAAELAQLRAGAVRRDRTDPPGFATVYAEARRGGARPLVTTELGYAALAQALADTEARLRAELVAPELERLLTTLRARLLFEAERERDDAVLAALQRARRLVEVGQALLSGASEARDPVVREELLRIGRRAGIRPLALGGAAFDYSALEAPEGSPTARVDRTLRWLAGAGFDLDTPDGARAGLALTWALLAGRDREARAVTRYERVRAALDFFHGEPDGPTLHGIPLALRSRAGRSLGRSALALDADALRGLLEGVERPHIAGPAGRQPVLSILGRRAGRDAHLAAQLTYPAVSAAAAPRLFASGLDRLAVEGMPGAGAALDASGHTAFAGFGDALTRASAAADAERAAPDGTPRRGTEHDDLARLLGFAREGLFRASVDDRGRQLALGLCSIAPLGLEAATAPSSIARPPAEAIGDPVRAASGDLAFVDPYPEWFARLASIARATADGLARGRAFASRDGLAARFEDLGTALDAFAEGARAGLERRAPADAAARHLGNLDRFCATHLPAPVRGVQVLGVALRPGRASRVRLRLVRGPAEVLRLVRDLDGTPRLAIGAGLTVREITSERRPDPDRVLRMPLPPAPAWSE